LKEAVPFYAKISPNVSVEGVETSKRKGAVFAVAAREDDWLLQ